MKTLVVETHTLPVQPLTQAGLARPELMRAPALAVDPHDRQPALAVRGQPINKLPIEWSAPEPAAVGPNITQRIAIVGARLEQGIRAQAMADVLHGLKPDLPKAVKKGRVTPLGEQVATEVVDGLATDGQSQAQWQRLAKEADKVGPKLRALGREIKAQCEVATIAEQNTAEQMLNQAAEYFSQNAALTRTSAKGRVCLSVEGKRHAKAVYSWMERRFPDMTTAELKQAMATTLGNSKEARLLRRSLNARCSMEDKYLENQIVDVTDARPVNVSAARVQINADLNRPYEMPQPTGFATRIKAGWQQFKQDRKTQGLRAVVPLVKEVAKAALYTVTAGLTIGFTVGMPLAAWAQLEAQKRAEQSKTKTAVDPAANSEPNQDRGQITVQAPEADNQGVQTGLKPATPAAENQSHNVGIKTMEAPQPTPTIESGSTINLHVLGKEWKLTVPQKDGDTFINTDPSHIAVDGVINDHDGHLTILRPHSGNLKSLGDLPGTLIHKAIINHQPVEFTINGQVFVFVPQGGELVMDKTVFENLSSTEMEAWMQGIGVVDKPNVGAATIISYCDTTSRVGDSFSRVAVLGGWLKAK